ncbi:MAG TPA: YHS domain-containing protein [Planctomycetota bacterium]|nr:YHS domain-containing protein [Planctomycetota bacterium]
MKMVKGLSAVAFALILCVGAVNADDKAKNANPTPGKCPVSGKDADAKVSAEVDGKTYTFCCEKCQAKFKESPAKFLKKDK